MPNLATVFICMLAGYLLRVSNKLPGQSAKVLNTFVIYVAFPALVIHHVPATLEQSGITMKLLVPVSMPWLLVFVAFLVFSLLGRALKWRPETVGALVLTAGFANTSFVGFPILEALLGPDAIKTGIIISQAGSFLALSTAGLILASFYSKHDASLSGIAKRLFQFPPFLAMLLSVVIYLLGIDLPDSVDAVLIKLAAALVPVALVAVGSQIRFDSKLIKFHKAPLLIGLSYKLILAPIIFGLLYVWILHDYSSIAEISVLESAMAPMITGAIVAAQFELDEELAYLLVGIGIPLSLLTVPGWFLVAQTIFGKT
ncbi:MAG: AEC family transporter [Proteobacteria bacterium]|nr:AEC family transporter [Pseudomonadota bacterium]